MSKTTAYIGDYLNLVFKNVSGGSVAAIGSGLPVSVTAGSLYLSLHTADPGVGGSQTTSEAAYTGYARQAVARGAGFTVASPSVALAAQANFPACTAGSEIETHWGIGTALTGAGNLLYSGAIGSSQGEFTALSATGILTLPGITGLAVGDRVSCYALPGESLPSGITSGTLYYVKTIASTDQVTLSATSGGAALTLTTDGGGWCFRHSLLNVNAGVSPSLTTGTTLTEW